MQDRFKLRCFGKPNAPKIIQGMHDIKYIEIGEKGYYNIRFEENWINFVEKNQLELIQCTGWKDENGKLVFFDDLVRNQWGEICKVIMQTDDKNYGRIVLMPVSAMNKEWAEDCVYIPSCIKKCEVIGNIYENPKLLEA